MLNGILSVVGDLSPHVVYEEGFGEVVFIVGERHGLEMKSHHGTGFNIAELVSPSSSVAVCVEELGNGSAVLGEVWVLAALIPLLIVVKHVIGRRGEKLAQLLVLEDLIEDPDLIDGGFSSLISDTSCGNERKEEEMDLPDHGLVEHQEGKPCVGEEGAGPTIIHSVKTRTNLIQIVNSTGSPLPEVVSEKVVAVLVLVGVPLGLCGLWTGGIDVRPEVNINVVEALRRSKSQVVVAWGSGLAETSSLSGYKACRVLYGKPALRVAVDLRARTSKSS